MIQRTALGAWFLLISLRADAAVVINEVFYDAPDDLEDLQYLEIHNTGEEPVDLGGWKFARGVRYQFPPGARIDGKGYLVLCRDPGRFRACYGFAAAGAFEKALKRTGEEIELVDARGERVDSVRYDDRPPWPLGPDGSSSSLERISPSADGRLPQNWASSPPSRDALRPAGTPGKQNASFSENLPPVVSEVAQRPVHPAPDQPVTVEAVVHDPDGVKRVSLRYRLAGPGGEKEEESVEMTEVCEHRFSGTIPGQRARQIIRFRIEAVDAQGARRVHPGENEPRPAFSSFVHEPFEPGKIPFGLIVNVGEAEFKAAAKHRRRPGGRGGFDEDERMRMMGRLMLEAGMDPAQAWFQLTINRQLGFEPLEKLRPVFTAKLAERDKLIERTVEAPDLQAKMREIPSLLKSFEAQLAEAVRPFLPEEELKRFSEWQGERASAGAGAMQFGPEAFIKRRANVEGAYFQISTRSDFTEAQFRSIKPVCQATLADRDGLIKEAQALFREQGDGDDLLRRVEELDARFGQKLKPILTEAQDRHLQSWQEENSSFFPARRSPAGAKPERRSAFVYVDPQTRRPDLFDFVTVSPRSGGYKVRFQKDQPLRGMTTINLLFEYNDRFSLAEPLAYELYRRAGVAAELTDFVRLWIDGELTGYHLLVEQPNRAFLRRNRLKTGGNLYKILWYERGVVRQHEKKTHPRAGHQDLVQLIESLEKTKGDEQWEVIRKNFNLEQVASYFAVNTCLSHWDGFFNNYFTYHDVKGSGKWEIYPWDQDKTWGFHDGLTSGVFYDMPLTFGMEGDAPPGWPQDRPAPRGFGGGSEWWRPGGWFSKPLLAHPRFRKLFLARTREILETVYTEEVFFPLIETLGERLKDEVRIRAEASRQDPDRATARLEENLQSLKEHLVKRRKFLLEQDELRSAGAFDRSETK